MTDYTQPTGSTGTMMIRDTGGNVEFWLKAGSTTFNHQLPWGYTANGSFSGWKSFDFVSGGAWQRLGFVYIGSSQNVTFNLGNTSTAGLGGPTNFTVYISRASLPSPPGTPTFSELTDSSVRVQFPDGAANGAVIDNRQLYLGGDPAAPWGLLYEGIDANNHVVANLSPGTTYYLWGKTHNAYGWSDLGARGQITTYSVPNAPTPVILTNPTQDSVHVQYDDQGNGGSAILEWQLGYGIDPSAPQTFTSADGNWFSTISNLSPGQTYYFWARGRNAFGWGPWSEVRSVQLQAGAYVKVGTVWRRAVPYVNVGGTWKLARPWGKSAGVWKETTS